jgi:hypothetical protein
MLVLCYQGPLDFGCGKTAQWATLPGTGIVGVPWCRLFPFHMGKQGRVGGLSTEGNGQAAMTSNRLINEVKTRQIVAKKTGLIHKRTSSFRWFSSSTGKRGF